MSLDTYANLQTEIAAWLRRTDLTTEIPSFIALAEAQLCRRLRCRQMLSRDEAPITSQYLSTPDDFIAPRSMRLVGVTGQATLKWLAEEAMDQALDVLPSSGRPTHYTLEGSSFRFSPDPGTGSYTVDMSYYGRIPALSNSNTSNWLLAAYPDAYLYGALTQSAPYLKADDRLPMWMQIFGQVIEDINTSDAPQGALLDPQPSVTNV